METPVLLAVAVAVTVAVAEAVAAARWEALTVASALPLYAAVASATTAVAAAAAATTAAGAVVALPPTSELAAPAVMAPLVDALLLLPFAPREDHWPSHDELAAAPRARPEVFVEEERKEEEEELTDVGVLAAD